MAVENDLTEHYDRAAALDAVDGDAQILGELTEMFLQEGGLALEQIRLVASADGARTELKKLAHKLAGAATVVGAVRVYERARSLELSALEGTAAVLHGQVAEVAEALGAFGQLYRAAVEAEAM